MGARSRELLLLLAACALALSEPVNNTADNFLDQYEDYDAADDQEVLFNEDKPCPRDCICSVSQGYRIAKCNRLEIGTQKFGDDITDLVIENADPSSPISLGDYIFKELGLHKIATVKIVNSTISYVGANAFHGLHELYAVNLSNNKLRNLDPETFASNKKLLLLTLSHNPLNFPPPGSTQYFLNSVSAQELDISYCNMKYITPSTFKSVPSLMYLNVAGNNLSNLEPDTFKVIPDLEELDLSDNNIKELPDDLFTNNTELATLHIQRNPIDAVYGLQISDLLTLNAGQTNMQFIGPSMFNGVTYIANLNLSGNNIEKIHNQAFHKLIELNYLDLSYNNLDFISNILIKENIELDIFKISNNPRLKHLPAEGFNCSADQFNIYLFDASNCGLDEIYDNSLKTFTALSVINLSDNNIKTISSKVFSVCPKLVDINLAHNMLTTLDNKVFEKNHGLNRLNLQGNPLKVLSFEVFVHTSILTWLDISHGELTSLWKVDKNHQQTLLQNMTFLNASNNHITEIKLSDLQNMNKLRTFDISNNPLACSREFENLMTWLSNQTVSPNVKSASIANLGGDNKDADGTYSWEFLTRQICGVTEPAIAGTMVSNSDKPLPAVSDEEIWERIDKDAEGNFDLKNTLDDGKVAEQTTKANSTNNSDYYKYDVETDGDDDGDEDEDDNEDDDDSDDYDADGGEDDTDLEDDDDVDLQIKLNEKPVSSSPIALTEDILEDSKMEIKLLKSDDYDSLESDTFVIQTEHNRYAYLWPILIAILGALLLLIAIGKVVMLVCSRRSKQIRYNSAIIAAMSNPGRTKKNCGLVYQPLSEDLSNPATPKLTRYQPLPTVTVKATNMSYESSPFHHNNIVPEAV